MKKGTVKWFGPVRGYGFILGDDGKDYFVHRSAILGIGFRFLEPGQRVQFNDRASDKGDLAVDVVIIG